MVSTKVLAVIGLIASPLLASTPQGYGYGDATDSPESASIPSAIIPVTITDSVTITRPITITHTITVSPTDCDGETTTIDSTTSVTRTTHSTIYISVSPSSKTPSHTSTSVPATSFSVATSSIPTASTTGYVVSNTTTSPCESATTTDDVDGATASLSSTFTTISTSTFPPGGTPPKGATSVVIPGTVKSTTGIVASHTSSSTTPYPTIPTSMGVLDIVDSRLLAAAMGLVSLVFTLAL
ncbi:hypothetical protein ANO14919_069770 [Xylariales sp. No.14919]|nr:hypothetical protein ANO14919_069770 [Xylariales sp. No.14919]